MTLLDSQKSDVDLLEEKARLLRRVAVIDVTLEARKHLDTRVMPSRNEGDAVVRGIDDFKNRARRV